MLKYIMELSNYCDNSIYRFYLIRSIQHLILSVFGFRVFGPTICTNHEALNESDHGRYRKDEHPNYSNSNGFSAIYPSI